MMDYEDKVISLSEIDTTDDTCRISLHADAGALTASIQAVGLINPPVVRNTSHSRYGIICGFRRIEACQSLGWRQIRVRVLLGEVPEPDVLTLAISDNRSHRPLTIIEQARGIRRLSAHTQGDSLGALSALLGFPPHQKVFERIKALGRLPEAIQAGVLDKTVSLEAAADLAKLSHEDGLSFFDLFRQLKLSQSKQTEVITLVQEIGAREDLRPSEVIQSTVIKTILDRPELNRNEKGAKIRAYLKGRRFPTVAKAEERFSKALKALKLSEYMHITPPPYFEGGLYTLRMTFKDLNDFDRRRLTLDAMAGDPAFRRLLEPHE